VIGCEDHLRNDPDCIEWDVKLYSCSPQNRQLVLVHSVILLDEGVPCSAYSITVTVSIFETPPTGWSRVNCIVIVTVMLVKSHSWRMFYAFYRLLNITSEAMLWIFNSYQIVLMVHCTRRLCT